jgi:hypothetical protein
MIGCGDKTSKPTLKRTGRRVRVAKNGAVSGIDFNKYWPREEVVKLTPRQRAELLELALVGLKGNNWEHAKDVLVALRKDAVLPLIRQVDSSQVTAAQIAPVPVVVRNGVKSLGELSHDILLEIMQYHTNYKGQLPARKKSAWEKWWKKNQAGLKFQ